MKRTRNVLLALTASAMLALGATAPAFAGPPENRGTQTACSAVTGNSGETRTAEDVLGCE